MANIVAGNALALRCLGNVEGPRFLDGRTGDGSVGLAPSTDLPFTGTRWVAVDEGIAGQVILKCLGDVDGPRFLNGRTVSGEVDLVPSTKPPFSGTRWAVMDDGQTGTTLKCLGDLDGLRFLDGRTRDGSVGLAPGTEPPFTGTHWEVIDLGRLGFVNYDSGPITSGLPLGGSVHVTLASNGSFTFSSHAHDSGIDNIDYTISAVLMAPTGVAFTFQHAGHVEGTVAGLPFGTPNRNDEFTTGGTNALISDNWAGLVGGVLLARLDGRDTTAAAIGDLLGQVAAEVGKAAATQAIALVFG